MKGCQQPNSRTVSLLPFFWAAWIILIPLGAAWAQAQGPFDQFSAAWKAARYAEAAEIAGQQLDIANSQGNEQSVAVWSNNLSSVYWFQGRYAEAEPLHKRSLAIKEKALGLDHPDVAMSLNNLAIVYRDQGRYAEAEPMHKRALAIREKALGPDHPDVAMSLNNLALLYWNQGRYAEAEPLHKRSLAIKEKALGLDHPDVAMSLNNLASLYDDQGRDDQARPLLDRAIAIRDRAGVAHGDRFRGYYLRARIAWKVGRYGEAIADLRHALELAEEQRGRASGAEQDRATSFAQFAWAFERMVTWQAEIGDAGEALQAIERSRARSLLDQMALGSVDLLAGLPPERAEPLRRREVEARARVAELEQRLGLPVQRSGLTQEGREAVQAKLRKAREDYVDAYRDIRNTSPAYRLNLAQDRKPVTLDALRAWAKAHDTLVLEYLVGDAESFVLILSAQETRMVKLAVPEAEAKALGLKAGSLAAARLKEVLIGAKDKGIVPQLADSSAQAEGQTAKLAALWRVLVPEPERKAILEGKVKHLMIVPDGPLALLPFEALVVAEVKEPRYVLDAGPPIAYGPSATVLYNLAQRPDSKPSDREPVLAIGDPAYGTTGLEDPTPTSALAALTSRSRYSTVGGRLSRLPNSGLEARWVVKQFSDAGINAASFSGVSATERGVRYWAPGRRVLHLACHGLADQEHGNFFGALALTPGPKGSENPSDDGFLTLPEIYELDLKGTELAILSACQTNYGPQQKGEGTWALSRGFLVAGSRRVVASNWLVDDEAAAASLVSYFCAGLARAEKAGKPVDHAAALQAAKRWVRQQEKWKSPYYWASMVLIGPP